LKFAKSKITLEYEYKGKKKLTTELPLADIQMVKRWIEKVFGVEWKDQTEGA